MHKYILRRLLMMVPVILGVIFIMFTLMYMAPGDAALTRLGLRATPEALTDLRAQMGLDRPFIVQFGHYIGRILRIDFGSPHISGPPPFGAFFAVFPYTARLALMSLAFALLIGIPAGIACALKHNSLLDRGLSVLGLAAFSVPSFWLAIILIRFFSVRLGILPITGFSTPLHWILPSLTVGLSLAGEFMRFARSAMLEVLRQDYIITARAKGQKESRIVVKHALKNTMMPLVTVIGVSFGALLGGVIYVETIFSIPGMGNLLVGAVRARNALVAQDGVVMFAVIFSFLNLLVDILYGFIDPRVMSHYK